MIERAAAVAVAVLLLSGCAAGPGPLQLGHDVTTCAGSDLYTEALFGVPVENPDGADAVITSVDFASLDEVVVHDVWLVDADPQDDGTTLGYGMEGFPPDVETRPSWDDRVDAEGATLPGGHTAYLAIHFERTAPEATLSGLTVEYSIGSGYYTATSNYVAGFSVAGDCT